MLLLIFLVACPVGGAFALTYLYDKQATLVARLAGAIPAGQMLAGFIGYILAARWGLTAGTMSATAAVCLLPVLVFVSPQKRAELRRDIFRLWRLHRKHPPSRWLLRGAFALTLALLLVMMRGAFTADATGYYTNNHNNLGDLAFHLAVVQNFVVGNNFPPQHPEFAHVPLTYPFLVDFIAAQWTSAGLTLGQATWLQNALLSFATLVLLQRWLLLLTRRALVVALGPLVLLLSGGWGFVMLAGDKTRTGQGWGELLSHLPHDYTIGTGGYQWGNTLTTLWTTQRGLLLVLPLALAIWTLWWQARAEGSAKRNDFCRKPNAQTAGIRPFVRRFALGAWAHVSVRDDSCRSVRGLRFASVGAEPKRQTLASLALFFRARAAACFAANRAFECEVGGAGGCLYRVAARLGVRK